MPRGVYPRKPRPSHPFILRQLHPGDPLPEGKPRRYPDRHGYIRLRWKVGLREYVEIREHRAIATTDAERHVHHKDHNPANNDPSNLVELTKDEHAALHALERQKFDRAVAADLYRAGWSTTQVAAHFGVTAGTVSRGLRAVGVLMRPARAQPIETDVAEILRLHLEGRPAAWIGRHLGLHKDVVRRRIRWAGLTPHRPGRPEARRVA